jgi:hypothetical protein
MLDASHRKEDYLTIRLEWLMKWVTKGKPLEWVSNKKLGGLAQLSIMIYHPRWTNITYEKEARRESASNHQTTPIQPNTYDRLLPCGYGMDVLVGHALSRPGYMTIRLVRTMRLMLVY